MSAAGDSTPPHSTVQQALAAAIEHHNAGRLAEAEAGFRRVLAADPDHPDALHLLGVIAYQCGSLDAAEMLIARAVARVPMAAMLHNSHGAVLAAMGRPQDAADAYRRAITLEPRLAEAHVNLAGVLLALGRADEALAAAQSAVRLRPDLPDAHNALGNALAAALRADEAIAAYDAALRLRPNDAQIHHNRGLALEQLGRGDDAQAAFEHALGLHEPFAQAHISLGHELQRNGELDAAMSHYRRALELSPDDPVANSNALYAMYFDHRCDARAIIEAHQQWAQRQAAKFAVEHRSHANDRDPDRRIRVGYVSPDFRLHAVGRFVLPVLQQHDHQQLEIFCYNGARRCDSMTDRIRACADVWRETAFMNDADLAQRIRDDRIDILVDLTLHMASNRMLVFARKPAPVQVTYLAYAGTSGLREMDYRFTDPYLDPPGRDEPYVEESVRLNSYWCYAPPDESPTVNALPALARNEITFGCLNNFAKMSQGALRAWLDILAAVPHSRLLLHARTGRHRQRVHDAASARGVEPQRVVFVEEKPLRDYLALYQQIDIALDPFPYGGGTTTCDALWMGVPVITRAGQTAVGRGGVSLLSHLGLHQLITSSPADYVGVARQVGHDLSALSAMRASLRQRMRDAILCDPNAQARQIEQAYRDMWCRWCSR